MNQPHSTTDDQAAIAALDNNALVERYADGVHTIDRRLLDIDDEQRAMYFREDAGVGRWSCQALVVHLADSEMVLIHRMRRIACEERPVLHMWDEDTFIDACVSDGTDITHAPPIAGALGAIHSLRLWTRDWLRSLPEGALLRSGLHPERGEVTLRDFLVYSTWHLEHHGAILARKLDRFLPPAA